MSLTLAQALVKAHNSCSTIDTATTKLPGSLAEAMGVQAATVAALGIRVAGWKVGITGDGVPMAAPMLADTIHGSGGMWPLTSAGAAIAEVEIAIRLKHDLPVRPGKPWLRSEIEAACGDVTIGIEIICSRLSAGMASPFPLWLADRLGNAGYVTGDGMPYSNVQNLAALRCRLWVDGRLVHDKVGGHPQNDPLAPVLAVCNGDLHPGFKAGDIITTGSLITPLRCERPAKLAAEIDGLGKVAVEIAG